MVTADDDLLRVRERLEPVDGFLDLFNGALVAEVPGVDEKVPVRDVAF